MTKIAWDRKTRNVEVEKEMANEKLTAKKVVVIVVLTVILGLGGYTVFFAIILFTSPFLHPLVSLTLGLSIVLAPALASLTYSLKKRRKRGN